MHEFLKVQCHSFGWGFIAFRLTGQQADGDVCMLFKCAEVGE